MPGDEYGDTRGTDRYGEHSEITKGRTNKSEGAGDEYKHVKMDMQKRNGIVIHVKQITGKYKVKKGLR